jgi:hypothetical protein
VNRRRTGLWESMQHAAGFRTVYANDEGVRYSGAPLEEHRLRAVLFVVADTADEIADSGYQAHLRPLVF